MKQIKYIAFILIYLYITSQIASAADQIGIDQEAYLASAETDRTLELSIRDCIEMALKNNSDINITRLYPRIADANVLIQKSIFEPNFTAYFSKEDNTEQTTMVLTGTNPSKTKTSYFNFGYDEKFPLGTTVSLDFDNTRYGSNSAIQSMNPYYDTKAAVSVTQPLAKGFGDVVNKADFLIAKNNKLKSQEDFTQEVINTLTDVKLRYFDLIYKAELFRTASISLERASSLHDINTARYKKGMASDVDILQSEAEVALRDEYNIAAERALKLSEDNLKFITNVIDDPEYWNASIKLLDSIPYEEEKVSLSDAIKKAFEYRPDYKSAKLDLKNRDISVIFNRNGLFPTIDMTASYGLNGLAKNYGKDLGHVGGAKYDDWLVALNVKVPLGWDEERGKYNKAVLEKEQALIRFKQLEEKIIIEVRDVVRRIGMNYKMVAASIKSRDAQDKQYKAQVKRFEAGLVSTHDMLDFQDKLTSAEAVYVKSMVDYNTVLVELARVQGTMLEEEGIEIK